MTDGEASLRALVFAPSGRDAAVALKLLEVAGFEGRPCTDAGALLRGIEEGAGAAIIVEEALLAIDLVPFQHWVEAQPSWSDFPFIILTPRTGVSDDPFTRRLTEMLGNVSFIERPFRPTSLISVVRSALRGRTRQYEARARLEDLHVGQEQMRFAQEAGRIGTFELEVETRSVRVSPSFCRIWGLPDTQIVPLSRLVELLEPEDRERIRTNDPVLKPDALDYIEYRVRRPDTDEIRWIARQGEAVVEPKSGVARYFGVVYDITQRRLTEEALRDSEARFRLIADSAPIPMWVTRLDRKREFVNRAYAEFIGVSYEIALDYDWRHIIHADDVERIYREQIEKEAALVPFSLEARFQNAAGEWRWLQTRSQPRFDADGLHSGFIGVAYDITASRTAEQDMRRLNDTLERQVEQRTARLHSQQTQLRTMFETSYQLQGLLLLDGRLLEANARALDTMGAALDDVRGKPFWEAPLWANTPAVSDRIKTAVGAVAAGEPFREELTVDLPSGWRSFDLAMRHMAGGDGKNAFVFFEALETTERRMAEEQLRQAQKIESLGQLTGGIAHDFNNLLTGITGSLDLIRRRMDSGRTEGIDRFMDAAMTSAQRAAALTHRLLAFARRQSLDIKSTDANALVQGVEDLLRRTLGETITLHTDLAEDLWPGLSDANQLETALLNLAINARDAMPDGGELMIRTENVVRKSDESVLGQETPGGDFVSIVVSDTGTGMPAYVRAKAFDPFFTTKPIGQGTGLGLSMVYGFLKQIGGFVEIDSAAGRGTTVGLFLPRAALEPAKETAPTARDAVPQGRGETVLLVEDEASVRLLMAEVLEELGYRYIQASDGRAAIPILQSDERIDLLVTDVGLPHINGRQLAEIARQTRPDLKVLFVTGYAENAAARGSFLAPGMEMITKPFALEALGARIRALIEA